MTKTPTMSGRRNARFGARRVLVRASEMRGGYCRVAPEGDFSAGLVGDLPRSLKPPPRIRAGGAGGGFLLLPGDTGCLAHDAPRGGAGAGTGVRLVILKILRIAEAAAREGSRSWGARDARGGIFAGLDTVPSRWEGASGVNRADHLE